MFSIAVAVTLAFIAVTSTIFGAIIPNLPLAILASIAISVAAIWIFGTTTDNLLTAEEAKELDELLIEVNKK